MLLIDWGSTHKKDYDVVINYLNAMLLIYFWNISWGKFNSSELMRMIWLSQVINIDKNLVIFEI